MGQDIKERKARNAAVEWCRCFKCNGTVNETGEKCDWDHFRTCLKWYNGYRTAMLALEDDPTGRHVLLEIDKEDAISLVRGMTLRSYDMISDLTKFGILDFCGNTDKADWKEHRSAAWDRFSVKELIEIYMKYKG